MFDSNGRIALCNICKKEFTSVHIEAKPGFQLHVCKDCIEDSRQNFIWICLKCGKVYKRLKAFVELRMNGSRPDNSSIFSEDLQVIQGVEMCIHCDPEGILSYMLNRGKRSCSVTKSVVC